MAKASCPGIRSGEVSPGSHQVSFMHQFVRGLNNLLFFNIKCFHGISLLYLDSV